jgi:ATP-dependent RNA helicase DeaD
VSLGKKDGFDIRSFKDWVASSAGISWKDLHVDVSGVYSFVDAKAEHVDSIIKSLNGGTYNDRPVRAEVSGDTKGGSGGGSSRYGGNRRSEGGGGYGGGSRERSYSRGGDRGGDSRGGERSGERSYGSKRSFGGDSGGGERKPRRRSY